MRIQEYRIVLEDHFTLCQSFKGVGLRNLQRHNR
ncbi:hypothetical protein EC846_3443 [Acinetobacter sp. BIGb0102]|nr:hypothetical protein EC846_3443 [Acinetobacter sp. BIGb0102]